MASVLPRTKIRFPKTNAQIVRENPNFRDVVGFQLLKYPRLLIRLVMTTNIGENQSEIRQISLKQRIFFRIGSTDWYVLFARVYMAKPLTARRSFTYSEERRASTRYVRHDTIVSTSDRERVEKKQTTAQYSRNSTRALGVHDRSMETDDEIRRDNILSSFFRPAAMKLLSTTKENAVNVVDESRVGFRTPATL